MIRENGGKLGSFSENAFHIIDLQTGIPTTKPSPTGNG